MAMNYLLPSVLCRYQQILPAPLRISQSLKIATAAQARLGAVRGHRAEVVPTEGGSARDKTLGGSVGGQGGSHGRVTEGWLLAHVGLV